VELFKEHRVLKVLKEFRVLLENKVLKEFRVQLQTTKSSPAAAPGQILQG
jgi:hypothetical protein